jgi:hypothetical protein
MKRTAASLALAGALIAPGFATAQEDELPGVRYGQIAGYVGDGAEAYDTIGSVRGVELLELGDLEGRSEKNAQELQQTLAEFETETAEMRQAISGDRAIGKALESAGYAVDDVVAVITREGGRVQLVIDDGRG